MSSKTGLGSRASDEDARTAVRVGMFFPPLISALSTLGAPNAHPARV